MTHNEFKDRLFEILNETDMLPIMDIDINDKENQFKIVLRDGSQFMITTGPHGHLIILK